MRRMTTESIVRIVIGVSPERDEEIRRLVPEMLEIAENPLALMPQFQRELGGRSPFGKVMRSPARSTHPVRRDLARRVAAGIERGSDVLSSLAAAEPHEEAFVTDREIRDEIITLLIAGHETTANALAWAFERLLRHPVALDRLLAEPDDEDNYLTRSSARPSPAAADPAGSRPSAPGRPCRPVGGGFTFPEGGP